MARARPGLWCLGLASGPTSGWPGAHWIADILLADGGTGAYEGWLSGALTWSSSQVADAWRAWRGLVEGSVKSASSTAFATAARGMTARPPTCFLNHGGMSAMDFPTGLSAGEDYDYVTSSPDRRLEVSADFVGMFTAHNPSATALLAYLSGRQAQQAWVRAAGGYAFSADSQVTPSQYPDAVQQRIAAMLRPRSGYTLCFSAADAMKPDVSAAFYQAVLTYTAAPQGLQKLLKGLDDVQAFRGHSPVKSGSLCATLD
jgi:alpha-glucoside transport system substrate-binding protein